MVSTQLRILRVFGLTSAEVTAILRAAQDDGCPGLRLLERDGEFAVCVQASAPTQAMADEHCDKWAQKLRARFGDAFYGMGEISLAQAALDALVKKRRLIVAAFFKNFCENTIGYLFSYSKLLAVKINILVDINHTI